MRIEEAYKRFQSLRLLSKVARRKDQFFELRLRREADPADRQMPRFAKVVERPLDVRPRSVLR
jgi:hypothetical protein